MGALKVVQRGWVLASIAGVAVIAGLVSAPSAQAKRPAAIRKCDPDGTPPAAVIAACSTVLQDTSMQPPARAHVMLIRGMAEQDAGEDADAIADYNQVIDVDSRRVQVVARSKGPDADYYRQTDGRNLYLAVLRNDLATAYDNRGMIYAAEDDGDRARADFDQANRFAPDDPDIYLGRSDVEALLGDVNAAIADADRAAQLGGDAEAVLNDRCWVRAVGNVDLAAAQEACDRALKLAASGEARADALDSRALVRYRLGQFDLAAADEDAALAVEPDKPSFRFLRGLAEERLGRTAEGRADIAAGLSTDPKLADRYARWGLKPD